MRKYFFLGAVILSFLLYGCMGSTYSNEELKGFESTIQKYIDSTGIKMKQTPDGLFYAIIKEGIGGRKIHYNDQVTFYYTGSFLDGTIFQKKSKDKALTFQVNQLIAGWQDALMLLKKGGEIKIIVPPQLAYGDKKTELIPANSILKYDLTVVNVK